MVAGVRGVEEGGRVGAGGGGGGGGGGVGGGGGGGGEVSIGGSSLLSNDCLIHLFSFDIPHALFFSLPLSLTHTRTLTRAREPTLALFVWSARRTRVVRVQTCFPVL